MNLRPLAAAIVLASLTQTTASAQRVGDTIRATRTEWITPSHRDAFRDASWKQRIQGGHPRTVNGCLVFDGSQDGNRQVDPQIAVGNGYILHGTNGGLVIYNKNGEFIDGVSQRYFGNGIDPKLFYDRYNKVFGFDVWVYWDSAKIKPVNISVSETDDPRGAWNVYAVSASKGVDGGAIGYSHHWITYCFPGGPENTFVLSMADAKEGKPTKVYHFPGSLGEPVQMQGGSDDMYFFEIAGKHFVIRKIVTLADGTPAAVVVANTPHHLAYYDYPPQSPQKDTTQTISSGDRNPKNLVYQDGYIWFSQAINYKGRSAVQWHQVDAANGKIVQTGLIASDTSNYIQTTLAVNKYNDVLIGFQETNAHMYISPRFAYRYGHDKPGTIRGIVHIGEGVAPTGGPAWGDYSGSVVDPDNMTDMWTIQSVTGKKGNGETVIARFTPKDR